MTTSSIARSTRRSRASCSARDGRAERRRRRGAAGRATVRSSRSVDADGDGKLAFSDLTVELPDLTQEQFDAADIDNDDFLDETQYEGSAI